MVGWVGGGVMVFFGVNIFFFASRRSKIYFAKSCSDIKFVSGRKCFNPAYFIMHISETRKCVSIKCVDIKLNGWSLICKLRYVIVYMLESLYISQHVLLASDYQPTIYWSNATLLKLVRILELNVLYQVLQPQPFLCELMHLLT